MIIMTIGLFPRAQFPQPSSIDGGNRWEMSFIDVCFLSHHYRVCEKTLGSETLTGLACTSDLSWSYRGLNSPISLSCASDSPRSYFDQPPLSDSCLDYCIFPPSNTSSNFLHDLGKPELVTSYNYYLFFHMCSTLKASLSLVQDCFNLGSWEGDVHCFGGFLRSAVERQFQIKQNSKIKCAEI